MKLNFFTLCAVELVLFGSVNANLSVYNGTSLEVTSTNKKDVGTFESTDYFENLEKLKIDPNNLGVLIARFGGAGRSLKEGDFPELKTMDVVGSLTWETIERIPEYLPKLSKLIIDAPNFNEKQDASVNMHVQRYREKNFVINESYSPPSRKVSSKSSTSSCKVSGENGRIVIEGEVKDIKNYKDEIRRICLELGISSGNTDLMEPMVEAIKEGDKSKIQALVEKNPNYLRYIFKNRTACEIAVQHEKRDIAELLTNLENQQKEWCNEIYKILEEQEGNLKKLGINKKNAIQKIIDKKDKLLRFASREEKPNLIELLIKIGADVNGKDKQGNSPLFWTESVEIAKILIGYGANVNQTNNDGFTWLTRHLVFGNQEKDKIPMLELILEKTGESLLNRPTKAGNTALHISARRNYRKIAEILLKHEANIHIENGEGMTPFMRAVQFDSEETAELFLDKYSPDEIDNALKYAIKIGSPKVGNILLEKGEFSKEQLKNFIRFSLSANSESSSSSSDSSDSESSSGSSDSSETGERQKYLEEEDVNKEDEYGETPLFYACESGNENLVKYLVKLKADINKANDYGTTPLFYACESGNENLVKYLVELGADINKLNNYEETPLFPACKSGNENLVKYLVELGADFNKVNVYKETPLFPACKSGNENLVKYLVELGANINKEDVKGKTPLFPACKSGNENLVKYLVELGANINKVDKNGKTLLIYAQESGNGDLVKYLEEHGADRVSSNVSSDSSETDERPKTEVDRTNKSDSNLSRSSSSRGSASSNLHNKSPIVKLYEYCQDKNNNLSLKDIKFDYETLPAGIRCIISLGGEKFEQQDKKLYPNKREAKKAISEYAYNILIKRKASSYGTNQPSSSSESERAHADNASSRGSSEYPENS